MALAKQIIRLHATYANLIAPAGDDELQLYMIGIATDTDEFIFRSDDGYHRCLDSGTAALSEHSIPFINSSGKATQDNTNLQFNDTSNVLTAYELTTLSDINAAEYLKRSGVDDDYIRFENDKITIAAGGNTVATFEDDAITFSKVFSGITGSTIGNLTLANGSITDSSGASASPLAFLNSKSVYSISNTLLCWVQTLKHQVNHRNVDYAFTCFR